MAERATFGGDAPTQHTPLRALGAVLSQTAALVGLLYYFGWIRAQATYGYFGVNLQFLELSTTDVVIRSVDVAPQLLIVSAFVLLCGHYSYAAAARSILAARDTGGRRLRLLRRTPGMLVLVAAALFACAGMAILFPPAVIAGTALPPVALTGGAIALTCTSSLTRLLSHGTESGNGPSSLVRTGALALLFGIGVLWTVALYAEYVGIGRAAQIAHDLHRQTTVTVYSTERLALGGNGVVSQDVRQPKSRYTVQYSGLVLLGHTKSRYLLLPRDWVKGRDSVYVIPDNEKIRIDITAVA